LLFSSCQQNTKAMRPQAAIAKPAPSALIRLQEYP
jgi:hypothetical protein